MGTGTDKGAGHDVPTGPMSPERAAVDRIVRQVAQDVATLEDATILRLLPALRDARDEVAKGLASWLAKKDGAAKFTPQQYRAALVSLDAAFDKIAELKPAMYEALNYARGESAALSSSHVAEELAKFGQIFGESIRPTQIRTAAILSRTNALIIPRIRTSSRRYAGAVREDIRHALSVGLARGETYHQLTNRLVSLGGPKGLVALRGVAGEPGAHVEDIAEGLFTRYRHWADRVVRTEVGEAYNLDKAETINLVNEDLDDDEEPFLYRWDSAADSRRCPICADLDSRVAIPGQPFIVDGVAAGRLYPPAHPNCRCALVPWHVSWGMIKGEVPAAGEVPTGLSRAELTKYHPAPKPPPEAAPPAAKGKPPKPIPPKPVVNFDSDAWKNRTQAQMDAFADYQKMSGEGQANWLKAYEKSAKLAPTGAAAKTLAFVKDAARIDEELAAVKAWEAKYTAEGKAAAAAAKAAAKVAAKEAKAAAAAAAKAAAKQAALEAKAKAKADAIAAKQAAKEAEKQAALKAKQEAAEAAKLAAAKAAKPTASVPGHDWIWTGKEWELAKAGSTIPNKQLVPAFKEGKTPQLAAAYTYATPLIEQGLVTTAPGVIEGHGFTYTKTGSGWTMTKAPLGYMPPAEPVKPKPAAPSSSSYKSTVPAPPLPEVDKALQRGKGAAKELTRKEFEAERSSFAASLSASERRACLTYSGSSYGPWNRSLRDSKGAEVLGEFADMTKHLDAALAKSKAPRDMSLFRGVGNKESMIAKARQLKPGEAIVDHAYLSTSSNYAASFKKTVRIELVVPKGGPAASIPSSVPTEDEILIPRGQAMRVDRVVEKGGEIVIHCTAIYDTEGLELITID